MKAAVLWLAAAEIIGSVVLLVVAWWAAEVTGLRARWRRWRWERQRERDRQRIMDDFRERLHASLHKNGRRHLRVRDADSHWDGRRFP